MDAYLEDEEKLYQAAVKVVRENQRGSISLIQRHLRIGYNRAAWLIQRMEAERIVSVPDYNGSRAVLLPKD